MLRAVTVEFKSYSDLPALFLARELYMLSLQRSLPIERKLELNRRFAKAYSLMLQNPEFEEVHQRLLRLSEFVFLHELSVAEEGRSGSTLRNVLRLIL
ncbi:unnamed protein product [Sphagnum balticum]